MSLVTDNPQLALALRVEEWRSKARAGTLTLEETREAIKVLRAGRALTATATGGTKIKAAAKSRASKPDATALDDEFSNC